VVIKVIQSQFFFEFGNTGVFIDLHELDIGHLTEIFDVFSSDCLAECVVMSTTCIDPVQLRLL